MTDSEAPVVRAWANLPEGQRHPKNLAILAVEQLTLPKDHPFAITILQSSDYRDPTVSILVTCTDELERLVVITPDDDPVTLASRIHAAVDELVDEYDEILEHGQHS